MSTDTLHLPDDLAALRALVQQQHAALLEHERTLRAQLRLLDEQQRLLDSTSAA